MDVVLIPHQFFTRNAPRSNYSDSQRGSITGVNPSPPYGPPSQREGTFIHDPAIEAAQRSQVSIPSQVQQSQQPPQPPSPRRSLFDFVSPFDALPQSGPMKKKPVPQQPPTFSSSTEDSGSWTAVSDPKRQSVDNLLEHLTRQTAPHPQPSSYEAYLGAGDYAQTEQPRVAPVPIPGKVPTAPPARTGSPRASPPKSQAGRVPARFIESPSSQQGNGRKDKEGSPGPRGSSTRKPAPSGQGKAKNQSTPRYVH